MAANLPINFKFDPNSSKYAKSRNRKFKSPKFNIVPPKPTKIYAKKPKQNYNKFIKKLRLINLVSIRNTYRLK